MKSSTLRFEPGRHVLTFQQPVAGVEVDEGRIRIDLNLHAGVELDDDLNLIRRGLAGIDLTLVPATTDESFDMPVHKTVVILFDSLEQITALEKALTAARLRACQLDDQLEQSLVPEEE